MENYIANNRAEVMGIVADELVFSHEIYGEKFYTFTLKIPRLSGISDDVKIMVSDRLLSGTELCVGDFVEVDGQFRSYNSYENGDNRLVLTVFAKDLRFADETEEKNPNSLYLNGFICKPPVYRTTPFGREITDLLVAVNRSYNKSDYIPVIAWGRNAKRISSNGVGTKIHIDGRLQSRIYTKDGKDRTAYEVSITRSEETEVGEDE